VTKAGGGDKGSGFTYYNKNGGLTDPTYTHHNRPSVRVVTGGEGEPGPEGAFGRTQPRGAPGFGPVTGGGGGIFHHPNPKESMEDKLY
jgi:hypothetical protein